jgi:NADH-quinone oxidoreductase subunit J
VSAFPATQTLAEALFVFWVGVTVLGALMAVLTVRIIRSVCGLAICCFGLAGLFYCLRSPFLALMEILIYVGAVCITIVFAVMLAEPDDPPRNEKAGATLLWGGLAALIGAGLMAGLSMVTRGVDLAPALERTTDGSIKAIGIALLTTYSLPFELISVALLIAILGALAIARSGRSRT